MTSGDREQISQRKNLKVEAVSTDKAKITEEVKGSLFSQIFIGIDFADLSIGVLTCRSHPFGSEVDNKLVTFDLIGQEGEQSKGDFNNREQKQLFNSQQPEPLSTQQINPHIKSQILINSISPFSPSKQRGGSRHRAVVRRRRSPRRRCLPIGTPTLLINPPRTAPVWVFPSISNPPSGRPMTPFPAPSASAEGQDYTKMESLIILGLTLLLARFWIKEVPKVPTFTLTQNSELAIYVFDATGNLSLPKPTC
ncbi:hypothetical protein V8G54_033878 [Vigna mungo]|uniref:Uncharacterized protein n=1 Tax=Vigna mungo TaxID=3915 RepID=A0AAQ3MPQ6_VIGMU